MRLRTLAAAGALAALLAGCAAPNKALTATNNPSLYSVHQPVVERTNYVLDLATSGPALAPGERERLTNWFESIDLRYGDRLFLDPAGGYSDPGVRRDVSAVLAEYGLFLSEGAPVTEGSVAPGAVRIVASRSVASVPGCPNWQDRHEIVQRTTSSNFGCATNANLAAMIANPDDLVAGREGSVSSSAATAGRAIRVYRQNGATGTNALRSESTRSGQ